MPSWLVLQFMVFVGEDEDERKNVNDMEIK